MLGKKDVLRAAASVVAGYHEVFPLEESNIACLYTLIGMRLAVSVTNSAHRKTVKPDDPYVTVSEAPAWEALERLAKIHPRFAHYTFRDACGLPRRSAKRKIRTWLEKNAKIGGSLIRCGLAHSSQCRLRPQRRQRIPRRRSRAIRKPPRSRQNFSTHERSQRLHRHRPLRRSASALHLTALRSGPAAADPDPPRGAPHHSSRHGFFRRARHRDPRATRRHSSHARQQRRASRLRPAGNSPT